MNFFIIFPIIYCGKKSLQNLIKNIKENECTEFFIITFIKLKIEIIFLTLMSKP